LDTSIPVSRLDIVNLVGGEGHKPIAPLLETCKFFCDGCITGEMSLAINALASARCDISEDYADPTLLLSGEVRRLKTLCIYSSDRFLICRQQAVLDGWPRADSGVSTELRDLKEQLHSELPELDWPRGRRSKSLDEKWDERVSHILNRIANLKIRDPEDIYVRSFLLFRKFQNSQNL
jgi:hypothetical protein